MTVKALFKTSVYLICFVFLLSCGKERPEEVLKDEQMVSILLEVYLGEGKISALNVKRDSSLAIFEKYEQKIFEKFAVDREQYKKSLAYYYDNPMELEKVYEGVIDSLNIKEQRLKDLKEKPKEKEEEEEKKSGDKEEK
ncbi:DUF4296 domain-containing protein [Fulvivirga sp. RKSG066]|uniref:DUF4296 domain-containing protein n=1 Tax=Fulvivirga aurantia TaxID=2529383 RepID=UPI0012BD1EA6|nr:DUF4296 domain-containing protein [Fulvivirga aurantia]MTI20737.1 DUF4296 domain-containing protein [Fulvivirga aurantia]